MSRSATSLVEHIQNHRDELIAASSDAPFIVFLCGPSPNAKKPSARLRTRLKNALRKEGFEVVLGEDDGIKDKNLVDIGINAQDSELEFIRRSCNAVVILADTSP